MSALYRRCRKLPGMSVALALGLTAGVFLTACSSSPASTTGSTTTSVINVQMGVESPGVDELLNYVAKNEGFFKAQGLNVTFNTSAGGVTSTDALISGSLQVAAAGGTEAIKAIQGGANLKIFGTSLLTFPYDLVSAPAVTKATELSGKAVAVSQIGSASYYGMLAALKTLGVPAHDVTVEQVGSQSSRVSAVEGGGIAATVISAETLPQAEKSGLHLLVNLASAKAPFLDDGYIATTAFLAHNPKFAQEFRNALMSAKAFIDNPANKAKCLQIFSKYYLLPATSSTVQGAWQYAQSNKNNPLVYPAGLKVTTGALSATDAALKISVSPEKVLLQGTLEN